MTNVVAQLVRSERGKRTATDILAMLNNGAVSLDPDNQADFLAILTGAWTGCPGRYCGDWHENARRAFLINRITVVILSVGGQIFR